MKAKHAILAVVLLAGFAIGAMAQGDKVTLVGTISDTSGAVLPGSEVVLTRISTNEAVTTLTTETGDYAFRGVVPDTYQIKAGMVGFKSEVRSGLKFEVGRTYRQDFKLDVGAPTEQVEVRAESPILKTEAAELGQVIDNQKINSLPLNQRDVFGTLGSLTPGVQPTRGTDAGGSGVRSTSRGCASLTTTG